VVLHEALDNLQTAIAETGARVTHDPLPTLVADASQLRQLLQNLIGNALKFHGQGRPEVHVAATRMPAAWLFRVTDNGIGIDPEYFERVFVIFQRLHGRRAYPGTGVGLAICKKIVERHGGRIWVESKPGAGATFSFTLAEHREI
jgi:light-regulated signal transduction histidine kinase (bacteriophytochrome)